MCRPGLRYENFLHSTAEEVECKEFTNVQRWMEFEKMNLWKDSYLLFLISVICKFANFKKFAILNWSAMFQVSKSLWTVHKWFSPYVFVICCYYHCVTMAIFLCTDWLSVANKEPGDYDQFTTLLTQCGEFKTFFLSEKKEGDGFI